MNGLWFSFSIGVFLILYSVATMFLKLTPTWGSWVDLVAAVILVVVSGWPIWKAIFRRIRRNK